MLRRVALGLILASTAACTAEDPPGASNPPGLRVDAGVVRPEGDAGTSPNDPDGGTSRRDAGTADGGADAGAEPACSCPPLPTTCRPVPVDTPFFTSTRSQPQAELMNLIACAETRLQGAIYEIGWDCITDALAARLQQAPDLQLELVIDDDRCPREEGKLTCVLERLEGHPRVTIVDDGRSRYMHHKFLLADARRVWTGSANFTRSSFCSDFNDTLVIEEPAIVAAYAAHFSRLFTDRQFGPTGPVAPAQAGRYTVHFGPQSPITSQPAWQQGLVQMARTASTSLELMINAWTVSDVAEAALEASARGVRVRAVVGRLYLGAEPALSLSRGGRPGGGAQVHSKVMIIDGRRVVGGSPNWSVNSWANNEDSVWIDDPALAALYVQEFERIFADARVP